MSKASKQIFQTNNSSRWQRFKWSFRILIFLLVIALIAVIIALRTAYTPTVPILQSSVFKQILVDDHSPDSLAKEYQGFRKFIDDKWAAGNGCGQNDSAIRLSNSKLFSDSLGIRAAFYVDWDPQAFFSLRRNIQKLNLVLPEWLFFDPKGDSMVIRKEKRGYNRKDQLN